MSSSFEGRISNTAVGRGWTKRLIAAAATAAAVSLLLYFPDREDGSGAVLGGLSALIGVALGLTALSQTRPLPQRSTTEQIRLIGLAFGLGVGLGIANLGANYGIAMLDSAIYEQMVARWAQFSPWSIVIAGPLMEEIAYRLVLLSGLAWLVGLVTDNRRTISQAALGASALLFGLSHIFYGGVDDPLYAVGMAVKSSAAGLLLGWVFWRWGLPYSIICHCMANAVHLLLMPVFFVISM